MSALIMPVLLLPSERLGGFRQLGIWAIARSVESPQALMEQELGRGREGEAEAGQLSVSSRFWCS